MATGITPKFATFRAAFVVALIAALTVGCAQLSDLPGKERAAKLRDELRTYTKLLRWNEFPAARRYIKREPTSAARAAAQSARLLAQINVTHARLKGVEFDEDHNHASITHELRFFHKENRREVSILDRQLWWFDEEANRWFMDGDVPDFAGALKRR